jgi:hypothetical protein
MNPTLFQWTALGLDPAEYVNWTLTPARCQIRVRAERSVCLGERHVVLYPDPRDHKHDVVIGTNLPPGRAQDIVLILRGELKFSDLPDYCLVTRR